MRCSPILVGLAGLVILSGCGLDIGLNPAPPTKTGALVVGDEPYAVKAGAEIMAQGGNAVDAATAMYFALSVTYPVTAGLGGGGICLVRDPVSGRSEEFDFLARDAAGGGAFAVPGTVRGFASLQAAYGALPWQRVISTAEGYAAAGFPISRALAKRLAASENVIRLDAGLAAEFMDESGHAKQAGTIVSSRDLADTLAAIRTQGADALYTGSVGAKIVAYSTAQSGAISATDLAAYPPTRVAPHAMQLGGQAVFLPADHTGAGAFAGALFDNLLRAESTPTGSNSTEAAIVVATKMTLTSFGVADLPSDLGATGFAATDESGLAVACAVTMNGPFGSGHTAQGTGVTLARAPSSGQAGLAAAFLTPVIATDSAGHVALVGAGAGGPVGSASLADAVARLAKGEIVTHRAATDTKTPTLYDTVNAIVCQEGTCTALPDARADGMGATPSR